jgi:hypothetical protein
VAGSYSRITIPALNAFVAVSSSTSSLISVGEQSLSFAENDRVQHEPVQVERVFEFLGNPEAIASSAPIVDRVVADAAIVTVL